MSKPPRSDRELVDDMIGFCDCLLEFTEGIDFQYFYKTKMCFMACLHSLTLLGEASIKVSKDTKKMHPNIPWRAMSDLRNVLVHWYHGVELRIPWETIQNDIPSLIEALRHIKP